MNRAQIPGALLNARRADIDKIPAAVLKTLTRADLADRLLAAGVYRQRASVPHLDGDLFRARLGQASEVLATSSPQRAAELIKGAGVGVTPAAGRGPVPAAPAPSRAPAAGTRMTKAAGGESTRYPAVDLLVQKATAARSVADALLDLAKAGRLGDLERDIAAMRRDTASGRLELVKGPAPAGGLAKGAGALAGYVASELAWQRSPAGQAMAKAAEYQQKAAVVSDPLLRNGYLEMARLEREKAGA